MTFLWTKVTQNNTPRDTQAIFHFMGPFLKTRLAQDLSLESQAPHALTSQMFLQKGKKMFIFSYFCPRLYLHILEIKIFNIMFCT